MVPPCVQPVKLAIQHVRQPRQRMPVAEIHRRERPLKAVARNATANMRVVGHVKRIVEVDEIKCDDWEINRRRRQHEQRANEKHQPPVLRSTAEGGRT